MEQQEDYQATLNVKQPLDETDFEKFLKTLSAMTVGDYSSEGSPLVKRAIIAFELFKSKNWSKDEFDQVLNRFTRKHESRDWYPRTFLEHYETCFGSDEMVM